MQNYQHSNLPNAKCLIYGKLPMQDYQHKHIRIIPKDFRHNLRNWLCTTINITTYETLDMLFTANWLCKAINIDIIITHEPNGFQHELIVHFSTFPRFIRKQVQKAYAISVETNYENLL